MDKLPISDQTLTRQSASVHRFSEIPASVEVTKSRPVQNWVCIKRAEKCLTEAQKTGLQVKLSLKLQVSNLLYQHQTSAVYSTHVYHGGPDNSND